MGIQFKAGNFHSSSLTNNASQASLISSLGQSNSNFSLSLIGGACIPGPVPPSIFACGSEKGLTIVWTGSSDTIGCADSACLFLYFLPSKGFIETGVDSRCPRESENKLMGPVCGLKVSGVSAKVRYIDRIDTEKVNLGR